MFPLLDIVLYAAHVAAISMLNASRYRQLHADKWFVGSQQGFRFVSFRDDSFAIWHDRVISKQNSFIRI